MRKLAYAVVLFALAMGLEVCGSALNHFVIKANSGRMPVWPITRELKAEVAFSMNYTAITKDTHYVWLSDVIPDAVILDDSGISYAMMSVGDVILFTGMFFCFCSMVLLVTFGLNLVWVIFRPCHYQRCGW